MSKKRDKHLYCMTSDRAVFWVVAESWTKAFEGVVGADPKADITSTKRYSRDDDYILVQKEVSDDAS